LGQWVGIKRAFLAWPSRRTENDLVLERAKVIIKDGKMDEFLKVFVSKALPLTAEFTGLISFNALRRVEGADSVMLLTEWESVEAHLAFRSEPAHEAYSQIVAPYTAGKADGAFRTGVIGQARRTRCR
jgi:heme-degrading monooxygenase HmoA